MGCRAGPAALGEFGDLATELALQDCLSVLPPDASAPERIAHLTTVRVIAVETVLRDELAAWADASHHAVAPPIADDRLGADQVRAARAVASTAPLVVIEGATGAGKTTMLGAAIDGAASVGRRVRILTPTRKAAQVASVELGVRAASVAAFLHAHGFRWNDDGVWTRLRVGDRDPKTGAVCLGPPSDARLTRGERVVFDEAGMLDQDSAHALLAVVRQAGTTIALVGDRAQLPSVGRGGVLEIAAQLVPACMTAPSCTGSPIRTMHGSPSSCAPVVIRTRCSIGSTRPDSCESTPTRSHCATAFRSSTSTGWHRRRRPRPRRARLAPGSAIAESSEGKSTMCRPFTASTGCRSDAGHYPDQEERQQAESRQPPGLDRRESAVRRGDRDR